MRRKYYGVDDFLSHQEVKPGRALVIGSKCYNGKPDRRLLYENALGLDQFHGEGVDIMHDMEDPLPKKHGLFDHIDCCSVLEHTLRPWKVCENIESAMAPEATILIQVPFVWRVHNYPGDYWRMSLEALPILFPKVKWITRGYLMEEIYRKLVNSMTKMNRVYLQRAETTAFGRLLS